MAKKTHSYSRQGDDYTTEVTRSDGKTSRVSGTDKRHSHTVTDEDGRVVYNRNIDQEVTVDDSKK